MYYLNSKVALLLPSDTLEYGIDGAPTFINLENFEAKKNLKWPQFTDYGHPEWDFF